MTNDTKAILAALKSVEAAIHTQTGAMYSIAGQIHDSGFVKVCQRTSVIFAKRRNDLIAESKTLMAEIEAVENAEPIDASSESISTTSP